jgi:protoporphyrinogen IX oxidase
MIATLLKFLHIAAIAVWAAGLICLPFLNRQRNEVGAQTDLHRLHSMVRFFYIAIVSPAAFIAIGTGTALIYVQETFTVWFTLKLVLVGAFVAIHLRIGHIVLRLFDSATRWPLWRHSVITVASIGVSTGIILVVLTKPAIDAQSLHTGLFAPGRLGTMFGREPPRAEQRRIVEDFSLAHVDHQSHAMAEYELAAVPAGEPSENGSEDGQGEAVRQDVLGRGEPQTEVRARDREHRHRCDGVRPTAHSYANAFDCEELGGPEQRGEEPEPEGESRAPDASTEEERIAKEPVKDVDAQRRED